MAEKEKGVRRQKIVGRKPKLQAANGAEIAVDGEAVLDFMVGGKQGSMKFLDSDVKKPLGAVSAMEDEGNTVCFSQKWGDASKTTILVNISTSRGRTTRT